MQLQLNLIGRWMLKVFLLGLAVIAAATPVQADRIKDLALWQVSEPTSLSVGGVVVGLAGTGDGNSADHPVTAIDGLAIWSCDRCRQPDRQKRSGCHGDR